MDSGKGERATSALLFLLLALAFLGSSCGLPGAKNSSCETCHEGIEPASASHGSCESCHGGDPAAKEKEASHKSMFGGKNPSDPSAWEKGCGECHRYQLERVKSGLMHTNAGMIRNIQLTWEGEDGKRYAARGADAYDESGNPMRLAGVEDLPGLSGELYRKFCSLCHVGLESAGVYAAGHASGCAACHFPFNDRGTYEGGDPTVKGKPPYSSTHALVPLPDNRVCFRCHNRSGRIALSYEGLYDGNNSLVPTRGGSPGPTMISGGRNVTRIAPDIHSEKGMDCIDCHTSRDVMGDGYAYRNLYRQTETACEDCHGSGNAAPRFEEVTRENDEAVRESRSYKVRVRPGMRMALTAKGRKYSNVFVLDNAVLVLGKRTGKRFRSKVVTGTPEHVVAGHERLECHACHSRTVVQCYGCHTRYDRTKTARDYIRGKDTPGAFSETEDLRKLYPFPLAVNQKGRISPVTPGCQTFVTVIDEEGRVVKEEAVARFRGKRQLRFAPFYSHNTGPRAVGCGECHGNPAFLGFGQHVVEGSGIAGTLLCEKSDDKPLDGFLTMRNGKVRAFAAITREGSRPLNEKEVIRVLKANLCIVCHDKGKDKDNIYGKTIDYRALDDRVHRRLLGGR